MTHEIVFSIIWMRSERKFTQSMYVGTGIYQTLLFYIVLVCVCWGHGGRSGWKIVIVWSFPLPYGILATMDCREFTYKWCLMHI